MTSRPIPRIKTEKNSARPSSRSETARPTPGIQGQVTMTGSPVNTLGAAEITTASEAAVTAASPHAPARPDRRKADARDPGPGHDDRLAGEHPGRGRDHDRERSRGHSRERPRAGTPRAPPGDRAERCSRDKWQTDHER